MKREDNVTFVVMLYAICMVI